MLTRSKSADVLRFVIVEGVIKFGIPSALLNVLLQYVLGHKLSHEVLQFAAVSSLASGIMYGFLTWIMPKERRGKPPGIEQIILWAVLAIGLATFFVMMSMYRSA